MALAKLLLSFRGFIIINIRLPRYFEKSIFVLTKIFNSQKVLRCCSVSPVVKLFLPDGSSAAPAAHPR